MIKAACHCTAVRFRISEPPAWMLDCNCTICRRYGALWAYYDLADQTAKLVEQPDPEATEAYTWQNGDIAFHRCKACGCITHMIGGEPKIIFGVNSRMMLGLDPAKVVLRQVDNGHTGVFWTKSDAPPIRSRHPVMPPPGPDDWR